MHGQNIHAKQSINRYMSAYEELGKKVSTVRFQEFTRPDPMNGRLYISAEDSETTRSCLSNNSDQCRRQPMPTTTNAEDNQTAPHIQRNILGAKTNRHKPQDRENTQIRYVVFDRHGTRAISLLLRRRKA